MKIGQVKYKLAIGGIAALFLAGLCIAYFIFINLQVKIVIPENFGQARTDASMTAAEIVALTEKSLNVLNQINNADRNYDFSRALDLVYSEQSQVKKINQKTTELNERLAIMAKFIRDIKPQEASDVAFAAVSEEVSLISHMVNYGAYFNALLETLEYKFSGDIRYDSSDVQLLVGNMNKEVKEINSINESFSMKMAEFDKITEEKFKIF
ncbi:MAG: hypothetical protein PHP03_01010 [Candidatus Pacebacteria bacterium]|nr:hypothetical protein [Candidatus Paceibacterota bacterium]